MLEPSGSYHDLATLIRSTARKHGGRTALRFVGSEWTYSELDRQSDRVAQGLTAAGVRRGDPVATLLFNTPEFLSVWFGTAKVGAVLVPLNTALKGQLLNYELTDSKPQGLVIDRRLLDSYLPERPTAFVERTWVVDRGQGGPEVPSDLSEWKDLIEGQADLPQVSLNGSDPASILYTSGTTGPPKGAVVPHEKLLTTSREIGRRSRLRDGAVLFTALPLFHCNAQEMTTLTALQFGLTAAYDERFHASTFWETASNLNATHVSLLISMINVLYKQPEKTTDSTHTVGTALTAGATKEIWPKFEQRFHLTIVELYGMTECGCTTLMNPPEAIRLGSVGTPLGFVEADVVDDHDASVPVGDRGELVVRPREPFTMFLRYLNKPEETKEAWRNGWFHTGDYVRRDADGYYYFIDRKKDVIRRRGENIAPYDVESVLNAFPSVFESVVVGVASELGEDDVKAFVQLKPGVEANAKDLFLWCADRLPFFMVPRYLEFVDSIPKTANQKAQRYVLRGRRGANEVDRETLGVKLRRP